MIDLLAISVIRTPPRGRPRVEAHEVMAYAERALPPPQVSALRLWAVDRSDAEIATALGLPDALAARKLVRAAQKRLRTRFAGEEDFLFEPR
jgi:hypothetical protein